MDSPIYDELENKGKSESVIRKRTDNTMAKKKTDKQRFIQHTHKTKHRVARIPLKAGCELRCCGKVSIFCFRKANLIYYVFWKKYQLLLRNIYWFHNYLPWILEYRNSESYWRCRSRLRCSYMGYLNIRWRLNRYLGNITRVLHINCS